MSNIFFSFKLLFFTYLVVSFGEWFLHKYTMHGDPEKLKKIFIIGSVLSHASKSHLDHHKAINMNMKFVNKDYKNKNEREYYHRGLFFPWSVTFIIFIYYYSIIICCFKFKHLKFLLFFSILISIIFSFSWNNLHPDMHDYNLKIELKDGIPNSPKLMSHGRIYKWLWSNHAIHHLQKGEKGNFNIIFPGADYIFNTYQGKCFNNKEYCKKNYDKRICKKKKKLSKCF